MTGRKYTDEQIDVALIELALHSGSPRRTTRALAERRIKVPASTLVLWRDGIHQERYQELKATAAPKIEALLVEKFRENAMYATDVQRLAIERVEQALLNGEMDGGQAVNAAYKLGVAAGIPTDKLLVMTNRPDHITEHRSVDENIEELDRLLGGYLSRRRGAVDGTALDISPMLPEHAERPPDAERDSEHPDA